MRLLRSGIVALLALLAAGCSLNASPADGLQFKAPPQWQSSPGIMGFMQFWRPPSSEREVLMLFKSPKPLKPSDVFTNSQVNDALKDVVIERRSAILICGRQPATYIEARGSSSHGGDERVQMVLTSAAGSSYLALYVRPIAALPNPAAAAALRELCPK